MSEYQVLARRYRPSRFREVLGQDAIVTTLKNAIKFNRLAHAYLFCGSRGTGKTTLARLFAKALNCQQPTSDGEPCNQCSSCKEIASGSSLDVLEIDGASHRGIEDIRQINETVGYAASSGKYKIYIIDEVHMLTKEAFNALLKTLEEPPAKVVFFFATTEPHKVLPTILSRCQRFNLNRIPMEKIIQKLRLIAGELGADVDDEAIRLVAAQAEGGLRDAESLFDQILAFEDGKISADTVASILGLMPRDVYFELDRAGKEGNLAKAFEISHRVFTQGKDLLHFIEGLVEHFRYLLVIQLSGKETPYLALSHQERDRYAESARIYTQEQCSTILEMLLEAQNQIRFAPSGQIALEALLLRIIKIHYRLSVDVLVKRLAELESAIGKAPAVPVPSGTPFGGAMGTPDPVPGLHSVSPGLHSDTPFGGEKSPPPKEMPSTPPKRVSDYSESNKGVTPPKGVPEPSISEDPTPTPADLGIKVKAAVPKAKQSQYDTLLQFASVELEGKIQKNR